MEPVTADPGEKSLEPGPSCGTVVFSVMSKLLLEVTLNILTVINRYMVSKWEEASVFGL